MYYIGSVIEGITKFIGGNMSIQFETKDRVEESCNLIKPIYEVIAGKDASSVMIAMTLIIGRIGASSFDEDKDVFMSRVWDSVSESYDHYEEDCNG